MKYLTLLLTLVFFQCNTSAQIPLTNSEIESYTGFEQGDISTIDSFEIVSVTAYGEPYDSHLLVGGTLTSGNNFIAYVYGIDGSTWVVQAANDGTTGGSCTSMDGCQGCRLVANGCDCTKVAPWATKPWCQHKVSTNN